MCAPGSKYHNRYANQNKNTPKTKMKNWNANITIVPDTPMYLRNDVPIKSENSENKHIASNRQIEPPMAIKITSINMPSGLSWVVCKGAS